VWKAQITLRGPDTARMNRLCYVVHMCTYMNLWKCAHGHVYNGGGVFSKTG